MENKTGYDFIIVGAGSAGVQIPLGVGKLQQHRMFDWGYVSEPEPNLNGRRLQVNRGKVVGGSSSVNLMLYTRGDRSDFDRWARNGDWVVFC
jgi:4-pyridoxate dehydrogenase